MYDLDPPCDIWNDYQKGPFIMDRIKEICSEIAKKGDDSRFTKVIDMIYEYVEDNLENFLPEEDYDI